MIVEICFCFRDAKAARKHGRGKIFSGGFAVTAGNRDDSERE